MLRFTVVDMLLNHRRIRRTQERPIVLLWLGDISDISDVDAGDSLRNESSYNEETNYINTKPMSLTSLTSLNKELFESEALATNGYSLPAENVKFPPSCYRCNYSKHKSREEYERHCVTSHPKQSGYPGLADIREFGLKASYG